jgi:hypothetical protein
MLALPLACLHGIKLLEVATRTILAHDFIHAEHRRTHRIKSQRVDMSLARVATQNGKRQRTEHILMSWSIRACESKGRLFAKILPPPTGVQKPREEYQLPKRGYWSGVIPLHMIAPSACINRHWACRLAAVSGKILSFLPHPQGEPFQAGILSPSTIPQATSTPISNS